MLLLLLLNSYEFPCCGVLNSMWCYYFCWCGVATIVAGFPYGVVIIVAGVIIAAGVIINPHILYG